ncbi:MULTISPECIES: T3SS effector HopA1 family protein [unclassified Streptomyces]|uniref:T3SS effector HopA1 family protein n=1 Tax=unclassified Streptomyces TaxID=2593676 RepID=UPI00343BA68B
MTTASGLIAPEIATALAGTEIAADGLTATVGGKELDAKTPGALAKRLGDHFYQDLHAGMEDQDDTARQRSLRDDAFDQQLFAAMPHRTSLVPAAVLGDGPQSDTVIVRLDGLRVQVPRDSITDHRPDTASAQVTLRIPAPRPSLSTGFFLTDGSRGRVGGSPMLRLYFHLTHAEAAPEAWGTVLSRLEALRLRYRAKVTSSLKHFPRRDALVVYLGSDAWHAAADISASARGLPGLGDATSPFVHRITDGVGAAWEPDDPRSGKGGLSFGEHRCQVLAEALVRHAVRGDGGSREALIAEAYLNAGVDPLMPARNLDSPVLPGIGLV